MIGGLNMSDTLIVGVLSLLGTFVGSFSGMKLMSYRIEQLEKKVEKHNNFAVRMPLVENEVEHIKEEIEFIEGELKK
jgi:hypothetical protein